MTRALAVDPKFTIDPDQQELIEGLWLYFNGRSGPFEPGKGLLLAGGVGIGKSYLMTLFQKMFFSFGIINSRHIIRDYQKDGVSAIDKYGRASFEINNFGFTDKSKPIIWCFDDLGLEETNAQLYGNKANVIAEILLDRYDLFLSHGMKTYATTNLTTDELEKIYGPRNIDRFKQMFNWIPVKGKSKRK